MQILMLLFCILLSCSSCCNYPFLFALSLQKSKLLPLLFARFFRHRRRSQTSPTELKVQILMLLFCILQMHHFFSVRSYSPFSPFPYRAGAQRSGSERKATSNDTGGISRLRDIKHCVMRQGAMHPQNRTLLLLPL